MDRKRTDAERRLRQCERFSRLLRVLNCIAGPGRWDADALAKELECSTRTVHRLLQTLSMAGVPWHFDETTKAYKVRPGFRFALLSKAEQSPATDAQSMLLSQATKILEQAEEVVVQLRSLCEQLRPE